MYAKIHFPTETLRRQKGAVKAVTYKCCLHKDDPERGKVAFSRSPHIKNEFSAKLSGKTLHLMI